MNNIKVCHLTSNHIPKDGRIFYKECTSLAKAGYDVSLVVCGDIDELCNGVHIIGVPQTSKGRLKRMLISTRDVYKKAKSLNADIYHIHDPELLPYALKLKKMGKKVIFDSHEDYSVVMKEKPYLHPYLSKILGGIYGIYEKRILAKLDAIVSITPHLTERLHQINTATYQITNYKDLSKTLISAPQISNGNQMAYVGPIRNQWCVKEIIECLHDEDEIIIAGPADENYLNELTRMAAWKKVKYLGMVKPQQVEGIYKSVNLGFALLRYSPAVGNNVGTLGNTKLFEIMGAGIPVICTDFILWKKIIEKYKCGICINPTNQESIRYAIKFILDHPKEAALMGQNGIKAVMKEFNWATQEIVLLNMYASLIP